MSPSKSYFDHIIIGSGPGGMLTGCLLAEQQKQVLILEKGYKTTQDFQDPFNPLTLQKNYAYAGLNTSLGKCSVKLLEGEAIGGGSEVNSGLYHRTPQHILSKWSKKQGISGLSESEVTPIFKENEQELSTQLFSPPFPTASQRLLEISHHYQWKIEEIPRWVHQSPIHESLSFKRFSISHCYLDRFKQAGGELNTGCFVKSIKKTGAIWHIECIIDSKINTFTCSTLFICAGSLGTPLLLLKNRLIRQRTLPLYLHPMIKFITHFQDPITEKHPLVSMHQITEFLPNFLVGSSISSLPFLGIGLYHHPTILKSIRSLSPYLSAYYISVPSHTPATIVTLPGLSSPIVRYSISKSDLSIFFHALNQVTEAFLKLNTQSIYIDGKDLPVLTSKSPYLQSEEQLNLAEFSSVHLMGSCPMHINPDHGITNSFGKVYGHDNLYINDASLFCSSIGVNPQGTVMMLAKRNAYHFLENQ